MGRFLLEESLPRIPDKTKTYKVKHIIMTKSKPTQLDIFHIIKDYFFIYLATYLPIHPGKPHSQTRYAQRFLFFFFLVFIDLLFQSRRLHELFNYLILSILYLLCVIIILFFKDLIQNITSIINT